MQFGTACATEVQFKYKSKYLVQPISTVQVQNKGKPSASSMYNPQIIYN